MTQITTCNIHYLLYITHTIVRVQFI